MINLTRVISFRTTDEIYDFFKSFNKPFTETVEPLIASYVYNEKNKSCMHPVCSNKNNDRHEYIKNQVDML